MFKLFSNLNWSKLFRYARAKNSTAILSRRHIYIIPTKFGCLYALVLLAMLFGSINYNLSLGFVLTFLLAGMGNIAMLHTWRNLAHLKIEAVHQHPAFAGENANFEIKLIDDKNRHRYALAAKFEGVNTVYADIAALDESKLKLHLPSLKRGWLKAPRIILHTEFPINLFHAWAYVELDMQCLIYPHPLLISSPSNTSLDHSDAGKMRAKSGDDDFSGHRNYQYGDSPKRVDWKASSREQGLLIKQFETEAQSTLWLDWLKTTEKDTEKRISQLTRWVLDAHSTQQSYGLRLPKVEIAPNIGELHYHQCLQALALMDAS